MTTPNPDILPCPFCGKESDYVVDEARCKNHGGWGRLHLRPEEWNTRPIEEQLRAKVERYHRLLREVWTADELRFVPSEITAEVNALFQCGDCGDDGEKPSNNCPTCEGTGRVMP